MKGTLAVTAALIAASFTTQALAQNTKPLPPLDPMEIVPVLVDQSSWSESGDVIIERTFEVFDGEKTYYPKRRYRQRSKTELEVIWRSDVSKEVDQRFCAFSNSQPMPDTGKMIIGTGSGYTGFCQTQRLTPTQSSNDQSNAVDGITPNVVAGNQSYVFENASTSVAAGSTQAIARARGFYDNVNGGGTIWISFDSKAAVGACTARNETYVPAGSTATGEILAWTRCSIKNDPGNYLFRVQGCAVSGFLCDSRDFVTTVF